MATSTSCTKIRDIRIDVVRRLLPKIGLESDFGTEAKPIEQGVLRVVTEGGVEGNCFIAEFWGRAETHFKPILEIIKPQVVGREVFERERLWNHLQFMSTRFKLTEQAWAPVDVALWDIAGKLANTPIFKLLGAERYEIPAYAGFPAVHGGPDGFVAEAREVLHRGFRAYKIHPGTLGTATAIAAVGAVRKAVGDQVALMFDPDCGYDFRRALEVGRALDGNEFYWYEDPVRHHDIDAMVELSRKLRTPLSMSDQSPSPLFDGAQYIRRQAVRSVRGSAYKLGITGLKKLCSLAEGFGLNCEIGTAGNPLLNAANLHVSLSVRNCDFYECLLPEESERFGLTGYIEPNQQGQIVAPDRPGLGFEIDWEWIEHHRVASLS